MKGIGQDWPTISSAERAHECLVSYFAESMSDKTYHSPFFLLLLQQNHSARYELSSFRTCRLSHRNRAAHLQEYQQQSPCHKCTVRRCHTGRTPLRLRRYPGDATSLRRGAKHRRHTRSRNRHAIPHCLLCPKTRA